MFVIVDAPEGKVDTMRLKLPVPAEDDSRNVKFMLKNRLELSTRLIKKLKYSGKILLNSRAVHVDAIVHEGDLIEAIVEFEEQNPAIIPEPMDISILYEDEYLVAVDKPSNMVVHPVCGHFTGTVANGLAYHLLHKGIKTLIRPVSRLDRDTSGIILFALNPYVQENLVRQMRGNLFLKEYVGIVHGTFSESRGTINLPVERLPGSIMLRHTADTGAVSVTHYEVIERFENASFLKFRLETGRTHQIRVHCQAAGHPLIGDTLYDLPCYEGEHEGLISRQALHSIRASFIHPYTKTLLELEAPLPGDIEHALEILRK